MKITRRQQEFISKILDLYSEIQEPFHYTLVAERLGLSKYTAYDMLRLLEEKGYVKSVYETRDGGPGRASVLFQPTEKARETVLQIVGGEYKNWDSSKERITKMIESGEFEDSEFAQEVLLKMAGSVQDVFFCANLISEMVNRFRARGRHRLIDFYTSVIVSLMERPSLRNLSMLPGLMLGLISGDEDTAELTEKYIQEIRKYEILLDRMDKDGRKRLGKMIEKIFRH